MQIDIVMPQKKISRRQALKITGSGIAALAASTAFGTPIFSSTKHQYRGKKVLLLGIDGMDPQLLRQLVSEGRMPTFAKLIQKGYFRELRTTLPPQSPVAWSSFITGANPGKHGIYDFVARDPTTFTPYLSTSRTFSAKNSIKLGSWQIPLRSAQVKLMRRGVPFWSALEQHDIPTVLDQLPANFPVEQSKTKALSGMGTPDVLGSYGTSTVFSEATIPDSDSFTGTRVVPIKCIDNVVKTKLTGPANSFHTDGAASEVDVEIYRDPWDQSARIVIGGQKFDLKAGEWSKWIPIKFSLIPVVASVRGMVKAYLQSAHPHLKLYLSPINIDPFDPALPISSPENYSYDLAKKLGRFYTQGFPEDTKALSNNIFSDDEFFKQAKIVLEERRAAFNYQLDNFKEGVLFFYFSSVDQCSHMLWRAMHPEHHLYPKEGTQEVHNALTYLYQQMDDVLRQTLDRIDSNTSLLILSDHGFAPFEREINLSTWLANEGFTAFTDPSMIHKTDLYQHVDWKRTKAYVLGINSIYLNLKGREKFGSLNSSEAEAVKNDIIQKLLKIRDPKNGAPVVLSAYDSKKVYWGPEAVNSPDIIVGYHRGYRISDEAVLGKFPKGIVVDRQNKWSADHCMDPSLVPGVLLANKEITAPSPALWDLAPTVLSEFGITAPVEMDGKSVFA